MQIHPHRHINTKTRLDNNICDTFSPFHFASRFPPPPPLHHFYSGSGSYYSDGADETPEDVLMEFIARFGQTLLRARDDLAK